MTGVAAPHWSNRNRPAPQPDPDCDCCSGWGTDPVFGTECTECWSPAPETGREDDPIAIWAAIEALPIKQKIVARNRRRMIEHLRVLIAYPHDNQVIHPDEYQEDLDRLLRDPDVAQWAGDVPLP